MCENIRKTLIVTILFYLVCSSILFIMLYMVFMQPETNDKVLYHFGIILFIDFIIFNYCESHSKYMLKKINKTNDSQLNDSLVLYLKHKEACNDFEKNK